MSDRAFRSKIVIKSIDYLPEVPMMTLQSANCESPYTGYTDELNSLCLSFLIYKIEVILISYLYGDNKN